MMKRKKLTLGPCLFNWHLDYWKNFYLEIANTPVDEVYIGETVCLRRDPFFKKEMETIVKYLTKKGKKVNISTIQLVLGQAELSRAEELLHTYSNNLIEVNDASVLALLNGREFIAGPSFNNYNEGTLNFLDSIGAERFCLPYELNKNSIEILTKNSKKEVEIMVFGKIPLAISARCYHARIHNKPKLDCEYVCNLDYNGKEITTLNNESFLTVNGTQTMSYSYNNLIMELQELKDLGVEVFRISPHYLNMKEIISIFRAVLDGEMQDKVGYAKLLKLLPGKSKYSNGFYYGLSGKEFQNASLINENSIE